MNETSKLGLFLNMGQLFLVHRTSASFLIKIKGTVDSTEITGTPTTTQSRVLQIHIVIFVKMKLACLTHPV